MPLNIKNTDEDFGIDKPKPQPITREAEKRKLFPANTLVILFVVLVAVSAAFLVYLFFFMGQNKPGPRQKPVSVPAETTATVAARPSEVTASVTRPSETRPQAEPAKEKQYTIYIAAYKSKNPADEEIGRWKEAGYTAVVVETGGRFRVALGQFSTADEARQFASKLGDAFEYGYWIGKLQ